MPIDEIIDVILNGKATRQAAQISPLKKTYNDTLELIPLDIEKAKNMLDEAGWVDTDGDNIRDKMVEGEKLQLSFKLSYMSSPITKEIVLMIKESMYKAGVDAIPTPMDFTLFYKNAQEHDFDMMLGGWGGSASYSNPYQLWHTSSWANKGSNFCGFGDAESDSLINAANRAIDPLEHRNAIFALQAKIYEDQPYVFMYSTQNKIAIHKDKIDDDYCHSSLPCPTVRLVRLYFDVVSVSVDILVIQLRLWRHQIFAKGDKQNGNDGREDHPLHDQPVPSGRQ